MPDENPESTPAPKALRKGRCPRCGRPFEYHTIAQHKPFPFCSERCRDVDLGNWITGQYAIPGAPVPKPPSDEVDPADVPDDPT